MVPLRKKNGQNAAGYTGESGVVLQSSHEARTKRQNEGDRWTLITNGLRRATNHISNSQLFIIPNQRSPSVFGHWKGSVPPVLHFLGSTSTTRWLYRFVKYDTNPSLLLLAVLVLLAIGSETLGLQELRGGSSFTEGALVLVQKSLLLLQLRLLVGVEALQLLETTLQLKGTKRENKDKLPILSVYEEKKT